MMTYPKSSLWGMAPDTEKSADELSGVRYSNNRLYFYAEVDSASVGQLNDQLIKIKNRLLAEACGQERTPAPIFLHIASFGGSLLHGLAGLDTIRRLKVPVHTIVDGCCASAATFLTIAGAQREIGKNSFMLIHQLSAGTWGKYAELKDEQKNLDKFMSVIKDVYLRYTKIPSKMLDEILKHDLWFDARQCLRHGLVDRIV